LNFSRNLLPLAHVCGFIGKNVRRGRIDTIIGLDPAGPLFSERNPDGRLDAGDANYVEALHTNGPTLLIVGAGIGRVIGHADFFANGGTSQPG
jgi:pancreatic triacylglycerol lipase